MAKLTIETALKRVIRNLEQTTRRFQLAMRQRRGNQLAGRALARLKTEPGSPVYPIRWKNERQRRGFFASKGFGRGIPASRSNPSAVLAGWDAEFVSTEDGGIVALTNSEPHMKYVQGDSVQPFHLDTGYVQVNDVEQEAFFEMEGVAVQEFFVSADLLEGV